MRESAELRQKKPLLGKNITEDHAADPGWAFCFASYHPENI